MRDLNNLVICESREEDTMKKVNNIQVRKDIFTEPPRKDAAPFSPPQMSSDEDNISFKRQRFSFEEVSPPKDVPPPKRVKYQREILEDEGNLSFEDEDVLVERNVDFQENIIDDSNDSNINNNDLRRKLNQRSLKKKKFDREKWRKHRNEENLSQNQEELSCRIKASESQLQSLYIKELKNKLDVDKYRKVEEECEEESREAQARFREAEANFKDARNNRKESEEEGKDIVNEILLVKSTIAKDEEKLENLRAAHSRRPGNDGESVSPSFNITVPRKIVFDDNNSSTEYYETNDGVGPIFAQNVTVNVNPPKLNGVSRFEKLDSRWFFELLHNNHCQALPRDQYFCQVCEVQGNEGIILSHIGGKRHQTKMCQLFDH